MSMKSILTTAAVAIAAIFVAKKFLPADIASQL